MEINTIHKFCMTRTAVQYSTVQYSTVQYSTVQYSTVLNCDVIQYVTIPVISIFWWPATSLKIAKETARSYGLLKSRWYDPQGWLRLNQEFGSMISILHPVDDTSTLSPTAIGIAIRAFAPWMPRREKREKRRKKRRKKSWQI